MLIFLKIGVQYEQKTGRCFLTLWSSSVDEAGVSQLFLCAAARAPFSKRGPPTAWGQGSIKSDSARMILQLSAQDIDDKGHFYLLALSIVGSSYPVY